MITGLVLGPLLVAIWPCWCWELQLIEEEERH